MSESVGAGGWLEGLPFWVTSTPGGVSGGSPQAGFNLLPDEARSLLSQLKGIEEDLQGMCQKAHKLTQMRSPADIPPCNEYNALAVRAFSYGAGHLELMLRYVQELTGRMQQALDVYEQGDGHAKAALTQIGGQGA